MNKKSQVKKHIHRFLLNTICLEKLNIKKTKNKHNNRKEKLVYDK